MRCKLCKAEQVRTRYSLGAFDVMRCSQCGLVFLDSHDGPPDQGSKYSRDYYEERDAYYYRNSIVDPESGIEHESIKDFRKGLEIIAGMKRPGRILDVGCALGIFLAMARERGWETYGVDISKFAVEFAEKRFGGQFFAGHLRDARFPERFFDVITLWDCLEHLEDPLEELAEIKRILKDDGVILFDTPNAESLMRLIAGLIYRASAGSIRYPVEKLYHIYHLYYFSPETVANLLGQAGLRVRLMRRKTIPLAKARGGPVEKVLVRTLSMLERAFHREYEILVLAEKEDVAS